MTDGTMGGRPASRGSMAPPNLAETIKQKRDLDQLEQATRKADDTVKQVEAGKEQERQDQIDKMLPKEVETSAGPMSYDLFRHAFKDVFDAVSDADHWAYGYVAHADELSPGLKVRVRTFRRLEGDILRGLVPTAATFSEGDAAGLNDASVKYVTTKILLGLLEFSPGGTSVLPGELPLLEKDVEKWLALPAVVERRRWLDGLPDMAVGMIEGKINDTMLAYRLATTEHLKNRLAPPSPSTA